MTAEPFMTASPSLPLAPCQKVCIKSQLTSCKAVPLQMCLCMQEPTASEEVYLIVESVLAVLLRTILEVANRPQPAGPTLRPQVQDVTVRRNK